MASYLVYSELSDGYIKSTNSTYSTARAGSNLSVTDDDASTAFAIGQELDGSTYDVRQAFFQFDTSFLQSDETVLTAALRLYHPSNTGSAHTLEVREHDWGASLGTGDFVAGANLGSKTLLAEYERSSSESAGNITYFSTGDFPDAINKSGNTRIMVHAKEQRTGEEPT